MLIFKSGKILLLGFLLTNPITGICQNAFDQVKWEVFSTLPAAPGQAAQYGVAGAFAGITNGVMVLAGGANFPGSKPWEGGEKIFWDDIFVYKWGNNKSGKWLDKTFHLPFAIAYGASVSTDKGIFCVGGINKDKILSETFFLKYDANKEQVKITSFVTLPQPLFNLSATVICNSVFVAGGEDSLVTKRFFIKLNFLPQNLPGNHCQFGIVPLFPMQYW